MNKQEKVKFIEKILSWGSWCNEVHTGEIDRYVKISKVRELIKCVNEPQKVKVPERAAGMIREGHGLGASKLEIITNAISFASVCKNDEFTLWFDKNKDVFVEAVVNGYEVEEEPKWKIINGQKYCLTSIEAGYGNSLHWAFDSTKKKPILFDNEETALYTAYITGGTVEKV